MLGIFILSGLFTILDTTLPGLADAVSKAPHQAKSSGTARQAAVETALRYAEAIARGDKVAAGQLDFACQYKQVTDSSMEPKPSATFESLYDDCWQALTASHASFMKRSDIGMDVLWPSTGPLVFYGDDLSRAPASAFVMDALGIAPPGTGLHLSITNSRSIPNGSFRLTPNGKVIGVPTALVELTVHYHDPLTSPVTYGPGTVQWTSTIKRERRAVKSITTQWVVFTGLRPHGFPRDTAVFHLPVKTAPEAPGMVAETNRLPPKPAVPFSTPLSVGDPTINLAR